MKVLGIRFSMTLAALLLGGALAAQAQAETKLTLAHGAGPTNPRAIAAVKFAELVKAKSNGRLSIDINPGGKVGENLEMLTNMRAGTLDMSINTHGTLASVVPEVAAFSLPFAFSSSAKVWEILDGDVGQDLARRVEGQGLVVLGWMDNGSRQMTNNKRPINKPEDLQGLRMRTTSDKAMMDMMRAFGALPVPVSFDVIYEAMKSGYVDGQENPLTNIKSKKMHQVQKYIAITNHSYGLAPVLMSKTAWNKLSSDDRQIIREATQEAAALQRKLTEEANNKILEDYKKMDTVQLTFPEQAAFRAASNKVWDTWELKPFGDFVKKLRAASK